MLDCSLLSFFNKIQLIIDDDNNKTKKTREIIIGILSLIIIYGLSIKFLLALRFPLISDYILPGLYSKEILNSNDLLLSDVHYNSDYPYLFTDIYPFNLIFQLLTNFDPMGLRLASFLIFLLIIVVFSYAIFLITKNIIYSFFFAALIANLDPVTYMQYICPASHITSTFFACVLMLIFLNINYNLKKLQNYLIVFFSALLSNLLIFSDSIFLPLFILPFFIWYIFRYHTKTIFSNIIASAIIISTLITYYVKTHFILSYYRGDFEFLGLQKILFINIPLYFKSLLFDINSGLYKIIIEPGIFDYLIGVLFILLIYYVLKYYLSIKKLSDYEFFLLVASVFLLLAFIMTVKEDSIQFTRYLTFSGITVFVFIILALKQKKAVYSFLLIILLVSSIFVQYSGLMRYGPAPDNDQIELINYLKENNLTYGYGDFWDAHPITYLSKGEVTVRPVQIFNGNIYPFRWLAAEHWFQEKINDNRIFIIFHTNINLKKDELDRFISINKPEKSLEYNGYNIYVYNVTKFTD